MKQYLFLLSIFVHSLIFSMEQDEKKYKAQEKEPVRNELIAHLRQKLFDKELGFLSLESLSFEQTIHTWCSDQEEPLRLRLWLESKQPIDQRSLEHLSIVALLRIKDSFQEQSFQDRIKEAISKEQDCIKKKIELRNQENYTPLSNLDANPDSSHDFYLSVEDDFEDDKEDTCSCFCLKKFFGFHAKKN